MDQAAGLRSDGPAKAVSFNSTRCLAIGGGKGGVGKTVVSVGLSTALTERGKRVLLFDGDMGLANIDLQMGIVPEYTLQDVLFGQCPMEKACVHVENGPDVLVSASGAPELVDLSDARRGMFIDELFRFASQYDFFIVDTGAGIGRSTMDFLAACPEVYLVLTNEPTSLMDAYAVIKTLHMRSEGQHLGVVVNMVDTQHEGEALFEKLNAISQQFIGETLSLDGVVVYDRRVSEAIRRQQSIVRYAQNGRVACCLRELADQIMIRPKRSAQKWTLDQWVAQWQKSEFLNAEKKGQ